MSELLNKECECNVCCHHYVCGMCTTHKAENYKGCDFYMPYFLPAAPFKTFDTETEWRNAVNKISETNALLKRSQTEYETMTHNVSGLLEE